MALDCMIPCQNECRDLVCRPNFFISNEGDLKVASDAEIRNSLEENSKKLLSILNANSVIFNKVTIPILKSIPRIIQHPDTRIHQLEFENVSHIGSGGFSSVYSGVHRLDGKKYALKILHNISSRNALKQAMKEVALLSRLEHPNIVRYYTCWVEADLWSDQNATSKSSSDCSQNYLPHHPSSAFSSPISSSDSGESSSASDDLSSSGVLALRRSISHRPRPADIQKPSLFIQMELCHFTLHDWILHRNSRLLLSKNLALPCAIEEANSRAIFRFSEESSTTTSEKLIRTWPWCRMSRAPIRYLFDQIVCGVHYLHQNGILHRDIKPANVFLVGPALDNISEKPCFHELGSTSVKSSDELYEHEIDLCYHLLTVKLGDFGLSTLLTLPVGIFPHPHSAQNPSSLYPDVLSDALSTVVSQHMIVPTQKALLTGNVGTLFYTAPEVLEHNRPRNVYGFKVDIYSLGIIFFQLLYPCYTESELAFHLMHFQRREQVAEAKNSTISSTVFLPKELRLMWPEESIQLSRMLSYKPEFRPNSSELIAQLSRTSEVFQRSASDVANYRLYHNSPSQQSLFSDEKVIGSPTFIDRLLYQNRALEKEVAHLRRKIATLTPDVQDKSVP